MPEECAMLQLSLYSVMYSMPLDLLLQASMHKAAQIHQAPASILHGEQRRSRILHLKLTADAAWLVSHQGDNTVWRELLHSGGVVLCCRHRRGWDTRQASLCP